MHEFNVIWNACNSVVSIYVSTINVYLGNRATLLAITGLLMLEDMPRIHHGFYQLFFSNWLKFHNFK